MTTTVIFYLGRGGWRDRAIRLLTGSIYSHCELVGDRYIASRYHTIGASKRDGSRVREAHINAASGHWDALTFEVDPEVAWRRAREALGQPYDTAGAILSGTALARPRDGRWFCSELCAYALGFREPHEFSPGMLAAAATGVSDIDIPL